MAAVNSGKGKTMNMRIVASLLFGFVIVAFACSARRRPQNQRSDILQHGLWACTSSYSAYDLDEELMHAARKMKLNYEIVDEISSHEHDSCRRLNSDELKFVDVGKAGYPTCPGSGNAELDCITIKVTDGKKNEGWVGVRSYITYMSFHVVRSATP